MQNARSEDVWQYVANSRSGGDLRASGYMRGDACYRYNSDPLSHGELLAAGTDTDMPLPEYMEYFSFLFGEETSEFYQAAKRMYKFTWCGVSSYTFTLPSEWFIENKMPGFNMADSPHYHYGDVRFTVKKSNADGRVTQISCSYKYEVDGHYTFLQPAYPFQSPDLIYIQPYGYKIKILAQFTYPEQDVEIRTDAQFEFSCALDRGEADKTATRCAGEFLATEDSDHPFVRYARVPGLVFDDYHYYTPELRMYPSEDVFVVYYDNRVEVYKASTLEKTWEAEHYLNVADVDVADGRLLVTLGGHTVYADEMSEIPWETNYCFIVYDLSDFSVLHRHKVEGKYSNYSFGYHAYIYGNRIIYVGDGARICFYDMTAGSTQTTDYMAREIYLDRENGRLEYRDESSPMSYDLTTGQVEARTVEDDVPPTFVLGEYELSRSENYYTILLRESASGETVCTIERRFSGVDVERGFAVQLSDGKYFCSILGCLLVLDMDGIAGASE